MSEESNLDDSEIRADENEDEIEGLGYLCLSLYNPDRDESFKASKDAHDYEFWVIEGDLSTETSFNKDKIINSESLLYHLKTHTQKVAICVTIYNEWFE